MFTCVFIFPITGKLTFEMTLIHTVEDNIPLATSHIYKYFCICGAVHLGKEEVGGYLVKIFSPQKVLRTSRNH